MTAAGAELRRCSAAYMLTTMNPKPGPKEMQREKGTKARKRAKGGEVQTLNRHNNLINSHNWKARMADLAETSQNIKKMKTIKHLGRMKSGRPGKSGKKNLGGAEESKE